MEGTILALSNNVLVLIINLPNRQNQIKNALEHPTPASRVCSKWEGRGKDGRAIQGECQGELGDKQMACAQCF